MDARALARLEADLRMVREDMLTAEGDWASAIAATHPDHRRSATNLVHYVQLRQHDVRGLQTRLADAGLSSLGRSEAHALAAIDAVIRLLASINGTEPPPEVAAVSLTEGRQLLTHNTDQLLGPPPATRTSRIMVTLPSEAATQPELIAAMAASGMDIARVNCAHDDAEAWERMIDVVRAQTLGDGRDVCVAMDLAGPKVRTGPLQPGPRVLRIAPRRDIDGTVLSPALVELVAGSPPDVGRPDVVPVLDAAWLKRRGVGDEIVFVDSRRSKRRWEVVEVGEGRCVVSATRTAYLSTGITLGVATGSSADTTLIGELPEVEQAHRVSLGDRIVLTRSLDPQPATGSGECHRIGCTLSEVFGQAAPGEKVWIDDGKLGGVVTAAHADEIELVVTDVRPGGAKLRAGKGINFPDTDLQVDALTQKDIRDLDFVAGHADIVNLSFVRHPSDVEQLQEQLAQRGASDVGLVLKIENVAAFRHLPDLLLTAMRSKRVGVMIARGDLAVEVGFERLAEVQEEILWACEAAHVPVIWATQVLDTLARTGQPSRAEITDAAMSERAECVMLNKGPHITDAIQTLDSILCRMQHHQDKKRSLLRRLKAWERQPPT